VTYGSTSYQYRKLCNYAYANINAVATSMQGVFSTLDECIDRCAIYNRNNATGIQAGADPIVTLCAGGTRLTSATTGKAGIALVL
jgi:hypothetical protein